MGAGAEGAGEGGAGADPARGLLAVVLAAGKGTRMRSERPKVLHALGGRSMLGHVLAALAAAGTTRVAVIAEPGADGSPRADVAREVAALSPGAALFAQRERLGTAHAVLAARAALAAGDDVLVAFADTPLVTPETFARLAGALRAGAAVAVLAFEARDPTGYGRVLLEGDRVVAIREERDASADERRVALANAGLMALSGAHALALLDRIGRANAAGEYYLTDAAALAAGEGLDVAVVRVPEDEAMGVNDRVQLAQAEALLQDRLRRGAMLAGATLVAPETVFLSTDSRVGRDVVIEPHVVIGPGTVIEDGAVIHAFSHLEGARVARGAKVGPYARLRPGADLGEGVRIGNFVEVKNAVFGPGAKANHLSYVGDASVGAGANVGAGTITCNYDGVNKHRTAIGAGAFVGSNSALVAPVTVGEGAYVGSGSVITQDVPAGALAIGRGRQVVKPGRAPKGKG